VLQKYGVHLPKNVGKDTCRIPTRFFCIEIEGIGPPKLRKKACPLVLMPICPSKRTLFVAFLVSGKEGGVAVVCAGTSPAKKQKKKERKNLFIY